MMGRGAGAQDQMARTIEDAERAMGLIYWSACDAVKAPIDPATLTDVIWERAYLAELHEVAQSIETDHAPWDEVRRLPGDVRACWRS